MAKIVIKADDFRGTKNAGWKRFILFCIENDMPATLGFIGVNVGEGEAVDEELVSLIKRPEIEIWNHSYLHEKDDNGNTDFCGPSMDDQLKSILKTQAVASRALDITPKGFGPPFNKYDSNTLKALSQADCFDYAFDIGYASGMKTIPKALFAECEGPKNGRKFGLEAAIKNSRKFIMRRVDFVLQIHPGNHWEESCIEQFSNYVRYARASGYEFGNISDFH